MFTRPRREILDGRTTLLADGTRTAATAPTNPYLEPRTQPQPIGQTPATSPAVNVAPATPTPRPQILAPAEPAKPSGTVATLPGGPTTPASAPVAPRQDQPLTPFGPGTSLRGFQVNPYASERLSSLQQGVTGAAESLAGAPDLTEAALEKMRLLEEGTAEERARGIRDIGRAGATLGRLGSGMVTTDLGNLEDVLQTRLAQSRRGLAADVAAGDFGQRLERLAGLAGVESQVYGQEAGARGELRGERGYQEQTARQAIEDRINQRLIEETLQQSEFGRGMERARLAAELGYGGSPSGLEYGTAQDLLSQASQGFAGAGDILAMLMRRREQQGTPPIAGTTYPNVAPAA